MKEPKCKISTGHKIYENLTVSTKFHKLVCSAGNSIQVFSIQESGKKLERENSFQADFSLRDPTINAIHFHPQELVFAAGGDDCYTRYYQLSREGAHTLLWEHDAHQSPIRSLQSNSHSLFVSTDMEQVIVSNFRLKQHVRKVFVDQLNPEGCMFQSAFFQPVMAGREGDFPKLIFCHYVPRSETFISKETDSGKIMTLEVSKDQSCLTAVEGECVGIACGKGTTYIIDTNKMKVRNSAKGHEFVVTAGFMTKQRRFITGTPECSYFIQESEEEDPTFLKKLFLFVVLVLAMILGPSTSEAEL